MAAISRNLRTFGGGTSRSAAKRHTRERNACATEFLARFTLVDAAAPDNDALGEAGDGIDDASGHGGHNSDVIDTAVDSSLVQQVGVEWQDDESAKELSEMELPMCFGKKGRRTR